MKKLKYILTEKREIPSDPTHDNFDSDTENRVKEFQKQNSLGETGIVDSKTREKLGL